VEVLQAKDDGKEKIIARHQGKQILFENDLLKSYKPNEVIIASKWRRAKAGERPAGRLK